VREGVHAALLVCALSDAAPAAAQTAGSPPLPDATSRSPAGGERQRPSGWLGIGDDSRRPPGGVVIASPTDSRPLRLPKGWTFRIEAPASCATCGDRFAPAIVDGNTPWRMGGTLAWQTDAGAIGVGVVGQRGARLPLFMTPSMGGLPMPAAASDAVLSDWRTRWQVTLSGERTVWRSRGGKTVSLFGDLYLPMGTTGRAPATGDVPTLSQTAFLAGIRIRF